MKLLEKYIAKSVLLSLGLVVLMLTGLQIFILFVNQLGDLGKADYGIMEAIAFVCFSTPYQVYLFLPMASLLGCLIGLGGLANHHELVVMQASGMSIGQITIAVLKVAVCVIVIATVVGESVMPRLVSLANDEKTQALSGGQALRTAKGVWLRFVNDFIYISDVLPDNHLEAVYQFHFNTTHQLEFSRRMDTVQYTNNTWEAKGVEETVMGDKKITLVSRSQMVWDIPLKVRMLSVSSNEPDEMTLYELHQFLLSQRISHQTAQNYQLAYWQRIIQPLTTVVMMMLAIPFIFGPLRSSTMGSKLLIGTTIGFGFYIMNRFFGSLSQVYQFSSLAAAIGPTVLFALLGLYLMRRVR